MRIQTICYLMLAIFISGCASITGSKNKPISVTSTCEGKPFNGSNCTLRNDKGQWFVTTPGSVVIQKSGQDIAVDCQKGKSAASAIFKSSSNGGIWGNILAGGPIGAVIDASSGAGFDYPPSMNVNFLSCFK